MKHKSKEIAAEKIKPFPLSGMFFFIYLLANTFLCALLFQLLIYFNPEWLKDSPELGLNLYLSLPLVVGILVNISTKKFLTKMNEKGVITYSLLSIIGLVALWWLGLPFRT